MENVFLLTPHHPMWSNGFLVISLILSSFPKSLSFGHHPPNLLEILFPGICFSQDVRHLLSFSFSSSWSERLSHSPKMSLSFEMLWSVDRNIYLLVRMPGESNLHEKWGFSLISLTKVGSSLTFPHGISQGYHISRMIHLYRIEFESISCQMWDWEKKVRQSPLLNEVNHLSQWRAQWTRQHLAPPPRLPPILIWYDQTVPFILKPEISRFALNQISQFEYRERRGKGGLERRGKEGLGRCEKGGLKSEVNSFRSWEIGCVVGKLGEGGMIRTFWYLSKFWE